VTEGGVYSLLAMLIGLGIGVAIATIKRPTKGRMAPDWNHKLVARRFLVDGAPTELTERDLRLLHLWLPAGGHRDDTVRAGQGSTPHFAANLRAGQRSISRTDRGIASSGTAWKHDARRADGAYYSRRQLAAVAGVSHRYNRFPVSQPQRALFIHSEPFARGVGCQYPARLVRLKQRSCVCRQCLPAIDGDRGIGLPGNFRCHRRSTGSAITGLGPSPPSCAHGVKGTAGRSSPPWPTAATSAAIRSCAAKAQASHPSCPRS
jgi:hypothetical protein